MSAGRLLATVLLGLLLATAAAAQPTGPLVPSAAPTTPATSDADIKALIDTLENEQSRAELVSRLKALESATEPAPEVDLVGEVLDNLNT